MEFVGALQSEIFFLKLGIDRKGLVPGSRSEIREAHRVMEANEAGGKMVVVH